MRQPTADEMHDRAAARGDLTYKDPETGLKVLTSVFLRQQRHCCRRGCRHCPYGEVDEGAATQRTVRPQRRRPAS